MARPRSVNPETELKVLCRRAMGDLIKEICYDFNLTTGQVRKILKRNHMVSKRKVDRPAVKHLLSLGMPHRIVAIYYGCDLSFIYRIGKMGDNELHIS
jgi:hypothetical protein